MLAEGQSLPAHAPESRILLGENKRPARADRQAQELAAVFHARQKDGKKSRFSRFPEAGEQSLLAGSEEARARANSFRGARFGLTQGLESKGGRR